MGNSSRLGYRPFQIQTPDFCLHVRSQFLLLYYKLAKSDRAFVENPKTLRMLTITVDEIQQNWTTYLDRVAAGDRIVIVKDGRAIAELCPIVPRDRQPRPFGLCAGEFVVPDDFDDPLPEEILSAFEGE